MAEENLGEGEVGKEEESRRRRRREKVDREANGRKC